MFHILTFPTTLPRRVDGLWGVSSRALHGVTCCRRSHEADGDLLRVAGRRREPYRGQLSGVCRWALR